MTETSPLRDFPVPLPARMARLHVDQRGFPVPWFVQWLDGKRAVAPGRGEPDFRVIDSGKMVRAVRQRLCWVCGEKLGRWLAFVIGPMCAVNRVISEPPSHLECARFAAMCCPFLANPRMRRNAKDLPDFKPAAGLVIERNLGVACVWVTLAYWPFRAHVGNPGTLFELGEPADVQWFASGRPATRAEVEASIAMGLPFLRETAAAQGDQALAKLEAAVARVMPLLPAMEEPP